MVILLGDAAEVLKNFVDGCIDLTVTSPPYDNLRTYGGHSFDFEEIACELYRVTKDGGILVWITGDQTLNGSETLSSLEQAIYLKKIGFKVHDTMIYSKNGFSLPSHNRYHQVFEYMFVFCKGELKTFNPILDRRVKNPGLVHHKRYRLKGDKYVPTTESHQFGRFGQRYNIWEYSLGFHKNSKDIEASNHPAIMSEELAQDHINSWSNEGDLVLDPFAGSGTTLKAAQQLNRKWIDIEINPDYVQLAKKRLTPYVQQQRLESFPLEQQNII